MKKIIGLLMLVGILLSGCAGKDAPNWEVSPVFTDDNNKTFHGVEGKFGLIKANGEPDEPEFSAGQGRLYDVYFLESATDFVGERYKMTATHKESGKTVELYEWDIINGQSGAKFGFDESGVWKIDVAVDDKPYTSFVIEVK